MPFYQIDGITPVVSPESFVHPTAVVIVMLLLAKMSILAQTPAYVGTLVAWSLKMVPMCKIIVSCIFPQYETIVEENGHIGHGVLLHGCHIKRNALVGMNIIMDGAVIGENSIVGACAFVKAEAIFPENSLIVGTPAKSCALYQTKKLCGKPAELKIIKT